MRRGARAFRRDTPDPRNRAAAARGRPSGRPAPVWRLVLRALRARRPAGARQVSRSTMARAIAVQRRAELPPPAMSAVRQPSASAAPTARSMESASAARPRRVAEQQGGGGYRADRVRGVAPRDGPAPSRGPARRARPRRRRWPTAGARATRRRRRPRRRGCRPKRLPASRTSNEPGAETRRMAHESTSWCSRRDVRIAGRHGGDHLAPQPGALQHVRLVDRRHQLAPAPRALERHDRDALDLGRAVAHRVERLGPVGAAAAGARRSRSLRSAPARSACRRHAGAPAGAIRPPPAPARRAPAAGWRRRRAPGAARAARSRGAAPGGRR